MINGSPIDIQVRVIYARPKIMPIEPIRALYIVGGSMNSSGRNVFPAEFMLVPRLSTRRIAVETAIENASGKFASIPFHTVESNEAWSMRSLRVCKIVFFVTYTCARIVGNEGFPSCNFVYLEIGSTDADPEIRVSSLTLDN